MQSRRLSLGLAAGAIAVALVLFIVLKRDDGSDSTATAAPTKIAFRNGAPVGGVREIQVAKGDPIRLDVTPDVPAEVHVHGYEVAKEVEADQTAKLAFPATAEGVFEVEVHHLVNGEEESGVQVAELNVTP
jgi:FtsP/CotA-like multicopper oxidase with cupredoxin domain